MTLRRPDVLVAHHLTSHGHRHPAVDHGLDEETPELLGLDRPSDRSDARLREDETESPGRYLVGPAAGARIAENQDRKGHLLACYVIPELD